MWGSATLTGREHGNAVFVTRERKPVLLRMDPVIHDALAHWAADEFRSLNAQIEVVLRRALADAGRMPKQAAPLPRRGRPLKPGCEPAEVSGGLPWYRSGRPHFLRAGSRYLPAIVDGPEHQADGTAQSPF